MNEILRKRLLRKLDTLPDAQLYQVLDNIEFLESKYAPGRAAEPGGLQRFAERMEDRLRARSVLPEVMSGTMKVFGTAGRLLDGISEAGRGIVEGVESGLRPSARSVAPPSRAPAGDAPRPSLRAEDAPAEGARAEGGRAEGARAEDARAESPRAESARRIEGGGSSAPPPQPSEGLRQEGEEDAGRA